MYKKLVNTDDKNILNTVKKYGLTSTELNEILKRPKIITNKFYNHEKLGRFKIGIIADTHIGCKDFDEGLLAYASKIFKKEGIKNVYHAGDVLEGMSGRDGHVYELEDIGFSSQIAHAVRLFRKYFKGLKIYAINGNHDLWFKKKRDIGADVCETLETKLGVNNFENLGDEEADIKIGPRTIMKLFHPNDGTAYAWSYKIQKLVSSLESGRKPNILIEAHYHKNLYMFIRNIHALEAGTICSQTRWMRGKKIEASKGFWVLDLDISTNGISRFLPSFYPAYE